MTCRWTDHALRRLLEYNMTLPTALQALSQSLSSPLSPEQQAYKFKKYGMESLKNSYWYDEATDLLFTLKEYPTFSLVLTVTQGRGNIIARPERP